MSQLAYKTVAFALILERAAARPAVGFINRIFQTKSSSSIVSRIAFGNFFSNFSPPIRARFSTFAFYQIQHFVRSSLLAHLSSRLRKLERIRERGRRLLLLSNVKKKKGISYVRRNSSRLKIIWNIGERCNQMIIHPRIIKYRARYIRCTVTNRR